MPYTEKRGDGPYPWRVRWPLPGQFTESGNQKYDSASGFAEEEDAKNYGLDMESDIRRGRYRGPREGSGMLLRDWAEQWRAKQVASERTIKNRDSMLDVHLLPAFGDLPLSGVNWWVVSTWGLAQTCARSSTRGRISLLSQILTAAVDAQLIEYNPIVGRKLSGSPQRRSETVWSTAADIVAIGERLQRLPERFRRPDGTLHGRGRHCEQLAAMLTTLLYTLDGTGMRIGEALALHRDNCGLWRRDVIDAVPWRRRVIRIDPDVGSWHEFWDRGARTQIKRLGPPKPPNGDREIDIPNYLWTMLEQHMASWPYPYLFCHPDSQQLPHGQFEIVMYSRGAFDHALAQAADGSPQRGAYRGWPGGQAEQPIRPGLSAHGIRHGHNTAMVEVGTPDIMRCTRMGHSTKGIQGLYSHPTPVMRRALLAALEERYRTAVAAHGAPLPEEDHFPGISQTISGTPRRRLRAV